MSNPVRTVGLVVLLTLAQLVSASAQSSAPPKGGQTALFANRDIEKGWRNAVANQKPLLVMFTSRQCLYCTKMLKETFGHPAIQKWISPRAETVLADAERYEQLVQRLGIRGFPTTVIVSPKGKVQDVIEGFVEPRAFADRVGPFLTQSTAQLLEKSDDTVAKDVRR